MEWIPEAKETPEVEMPFLIVLIIWLMLHTIGGVQIRAPSTGTNSGKVNVKPWLTEPVIVLTSPKNGARGFSRTAVIAIKFSENIKSSINWSKIELSNTGGHHVVITRIYRRKHNHNQSKIRKNSKQLVRSNHTCISSKRLLGNNLAATYTFKFKTGA